MSSQYVIVQYVPDPIIGERMNIGVIAYNDHTVKSQFISDWRRAENFGSDKVGFLKEFAEEVTEAASPRMVLSNMPGALVLDAQQIQSMAMNWANSIQLTEPRGSVLSVDNLLVQIAPRFLRGRQNRKYQHRSRATAARLTTEAVTEVVTEYFGKDQAAHLIVRKPPIAGRFEPHQVDVAIRNGKLYAVVDALSFEGRDTIERDEQITRTAYGLNDILQADNSDSLALSVAFLPPTGKSENYKRAVNLFESMKIDMINEEYIKDWTAQVVNRLPLQRSSF